MQVGLDSGLHLQLLSMNLLNSQESPDPWAELVTWEKENNSTQVVLSERIQSQHRTQNNIKNHYYP